MIQILQRRFCVIKARGCRFDQRLYRLCFSGHILYAPVGLLYSFVIDLMNRGVNGSRIAFYAVGALACLVLIFIVTYFQYNATYLATYVESGVRRVSLAEQLRKIPLSFFGKKDLADLTNSIMVIVPPWKQRSPIMCPLWQAPLFPQH